LTGRTDYSDQDGHIRMTIGSGPWSHRNDLLMLTKTKKKEEVTKKIK